MPSSDSIRILVVEDDPTQQAFLQQTLSARNWEVTTVDSGEDGVRVARQDEFDVVFLDLYLPGLSGIDTLRQLRSEGNVPEVVVITGDPSIDSAVQAMRLGAYDYVGKPIDVKRLYHVTEKAATRHRLERENRLLRRAIDHQQYIGEIVRDSDEMQTVLSVVAKIAATEAPVLISGETGVGKGLIAKKIHSLSGREKEGFVHLNCGGLQEQLVESELFGHEKGAFTGAVNSKPGLFEVAHRGTLFLDEVTELTLGMQAKLLQVLDSGELRRVGGSTLRRVNSRIITATNRDIQDEVRKGNFREDLYFRLNVVRIQIPPLRDRREDIPGLIALYLHRHGGREHKLSPDAEALLASYDWPGNVRELSNTVQRAVLLSPNRVLQAEDFPLPAQSEMTRPPTRGQRPVPLREVERRHILETLEYTEGNRAAAARLLGIDVKTLRTKLRHYEKS